MRMSWRVGDVFMGVPPIKVQAIARVVAMAHVVGIAGNGERRP